jgi:hypothetical protein
VCSNGLVQGGNHLIKYNLFLPWYCWKIITRSRKLSSWYSWNIAHLALIIITHSTKTGELLANNHLLFKICAMIELEKWNYASSWTIRPSAHLVYTTSHLSFVAFYSYLSILVGHDLSMRILYRFHRWLIFARVIALFMFVWPYVRPHILCTQLVICLLLDFIYIWYLGWPWSEHAHIIPISRIVDFCKS